MKTFFKKLARQEEGASMVEYGLLVALIALVVAAAAAILGTGISTLFSNAEGSLS
jgi:pilus assembly protein Flp/PilA